MNSPNSIDHINSLEEEIFYPSYEDLMLSLKQYRAALEERRQILEDLKKSLHIADVE